MTQRFFAGKFLPRRTWIIRALPRRSPILSASGRRKAKKCEEREQDAQPNHNEITQVSLPPIWWQHSILPAAALKRRELAEDRRRRSIRFRFDHAFRHGES